jgi:trehalose 6-phosphate synthase/phosphatase
METHAGDISLSSIASAGVPSCVFVDYDGTLVPYTLDPKDAHLSARARAVLEKLIAAPDITLVLVSGRTRAFLEAEFSGMRVDIAAEHGLMFRDHREGRWRSLGPTADDAESLRVHEPLLAEYVERVPGSFIEPKEFSITWHYRAASPESLWVIPELEARLKAQLRHDHRILHGKKNIEICLAESSKGSFVRWYIEHHLNGIAPEVRIALGDDETDERMFSVLRTIGGTSIKVGGGDTAADFRMLTPEDVCEFLEGMVNGLHAD